MRLDFYFREELITIRRECEVSLVRARNLNDKEITTLTSSNDYSRSDI